jgi:hypothetical protein
MSTQKTNFDSLRQLVVTDFDVETWDATEAVLSAHATLLLQGQSGGIGLVITGPSGSGKTTILKFLEGLEEMVYRSDDVTPASFVSHDSSKTEEQLKKVDLLPKIKHKTLLSRDMATWFAGDQEAVYKRMSIMAPLMDGDGYTRDTGSHGQRGYVGSDYRFNFTGATTPLSPRAWQVMGTVGNRLVFHEKRGRSDTAAVVDDVIGGSDYGERVARCREAVHTVLTELWNTYEGVGQAGLEAPSDDRIRAVLGYLTELVQAARAPIVDGTPQREGGHRIAHSLFSIAQGHALLCGRQQATIEDIQVCGRIALSTMPNDRRPIVRALVDPEGTGTLTGHMIEAVADVTRPTAHKRMKLLTKLGIATCSESENDGRETKLLSVNEVYRWPNGLDFSAC